MWWILIAVVMILLGVLGVLPSFDFLGTGIDRLSGGVFFYVSSILLVILGILTMRVRRLMVGVGGPIWAGLSGLYVVLVVVILGLYTVRTIAVSSEYDKSTVSSSYIVQARATISEISDSRYESVEGIGSNYRQKAQLSHIRFIDSSRSTQTSGDITNPFYSPSSITHPPDVVLPTTMTVLLSAYPNQLDTKVKVHDALVRLNNITPNSQVIMTLHITPIVQDKVAGFDGYRWLRTRHIHAQARVISIDSDVQPMTGGWLQGYRQTLREHFLNQWQTLSERERSTRAVTLSLLTGDRALIDKSTRELYQLAGILHLLAISGTHVVFLALILSQLGLAIINRWGYQCYHYISRSMLHMSIVLVSALIYALFTGFDVPAVRTVYMLFACLVAKRLGLSVAPLTVLAMVALGMIWLDPYVLWQAGFWLSFVAVALLMRYDGHDEMAMGTGDGWLRIIKLQGWLFIMLLPISILLFGKVSLWGLFVNLFAVGLFGVIIVPINLLAGVIFLIIPPLANVLWSILAVILGLLHDLLYGLSRISNDVWLYNALGMTALTMMGLAILVFLIPTLSRRYVIVPFVAWVFMIITSTSMTGIQMVNLSAQISHDDGLQAILIHADDGDEGSVNRVATWLILADFGSRNGDVKQLTDRLNDALKQRGVRHLTGIIIQTSSPIWHQVAQDIQKKFPTHRLWRAGEDRGCVAGQTWQGNGISVQALTGWHGLQDDFTACSIQIDTDTPPIFVGMIKSNVTTANNTTAQNLGGHRTVINGVYNELAWQLYLMLCNTDAPIRVDGWLGHLRSSMPSTVIKEFQPVNLYYTNADTPVNRQAMLLHTPTVATIQ